MRLGVCNFKGEAAGSTDCLVGISFCEPVTSTGWGRNWTLESQLAKGDRAPCCQAGFYADDEENLTLAGRDVLDLLGRR